MGCDQMVVGRGWGALSAGDGLLLRQVGHDCALLMGVGALIAQVFLDCLHDVVHRLGGARQHRRESTVMLVQNIERVERRLHLYL